MSAQGFLAAVGHGWLTAAVSVTHRVLLWVWMRASLLLQSALFQPRVCVNRHTLHSQPAAACVSYNKSVLAVTPCNTQQGEVCVHPAFELFRQ